jgi:uncharacterized protein
MVLTLLAWIQSRLSERHMQMEVFRTARTGASEELHSLLEKGGDPNALDGEGMSAMMMAAGRGHLECVQVLVKHGADIHLKDKRKGLSALKFAVGEGRVEVARYLLDQGADVNEADNFGRTGLMFAAGQGSIPMVELFLSRGADVNRKDVYENTALTNAEDMERWEIRDMLLRAGAEEIERYYVGGTDQDNT